MAAVPCARPDCTGFLEDGYCNVCGLPPEAPVGGAADAAGPVSGALSEGPVTSATTPAAPAEPVDGGAPARPPRGSSRLASALLGSARVAKGSRITRRLGSTSTRLRGHRLGAGITSVPTAPPVDPLAAVMEHPEVPEERRNCPSCGSPVGRSRAGHPGRTEGFCPRCRAPFSFAPKLKPGELVASQYEVVGCLAHGGLGWIYLARDHNVSDRWVVLKGLLNTGDADALAAAIAERQFLAQVEHPLIVEIYNFVLHEGAGYIVMEYVGGPSLKSILKDRRTANGGRYDPIPVDQAIAYIVEALPAFQYLHDNGLIYCDFKPDNLIQCGDTVKLIDLGGVRRKDDFDSPIYGTVGYQAPEVPEVGPSVAADIYTIGRTLVVLIMEFRGYQSTYLSSLPSVADTPLFQEHDSLHRLLVKACAVDPDDRFQTADELRVQLLGVLREVVAATRTRAADQTVPSELFEGPAVEGDTLEWAELPALKVDTADPMAAWLAGVSVTDPEARLTVLRSADTPTVEVRLAAARAALEAGRPDAVESEIGEILSEDPWEWRAVWLSGLSELAQGRWAEAQAAFNAVYGQVPGELAPKLALALACERGGEDELAEALYLACARGDLGYVAPAAFGISRVRAARGDIAGAVAALDLVAPVSRSYVDARRHRAELLTRSDRGLPALADALDSLRGVGIDTRDRAQLTVDVYQAALEHVRDHGEDPSTHVGGLPAQEGSLRDGLEDAFRHLAELTEDELDRIALVDSANRVRRWTLT